MEQDKRIRMLIAVGASVSANCQPCLQTNAARALEAGIPLQEIASAIEIGKLVRQGAASKMDQFISSLSAEAAARTGEADCGCGCSA